MKTGASFTRKLSAEKMLENCISAKVGIVRKSFCSIPARTKPARSQPSKAACQPGTECMLVLGISAKGAEYSELRILDVDQGTLLPESLYPSYGALGWTKDN